MISAQNLLFVLMAILTYVASKAIAKKLRTGGTLTMPPKHSYLLDLIKGKYDLKKYGPNKLIEDGYRKYGEIFRIQILHKNVVFLIGPKAGGLLFNSGDSKISAKAAYGFMIPVFGDGVVYDAAPQVMNQQVKWIFFGLGKDYMKSYCDKILFETLASLRGFPADSVREAHGYMIELVAMTAARCLLGDDVRESLGAETGPLLKDLSDGVSHLSVLFPRFPCEAHRKRDLAREKIVGTVVEIIERRRQHDEAKNDYLQFLLDQTYRDGSKPSHAEVGRLILSTLFGGQHTSSNILSWIFGLMAKYKDKYMDRILAEQRDVFKDSREFTIEKLDQMVLLDAVVKETLRLHPPLIILARGVTDTLVYEDYYVAKGDYIAVSPSISHKLPELYANPEEFDPDRYLPPRNEGEGKYHHIPFGGGRHMCVGRKFGYLQIKTIFAGIIQHFDIDLIDKSWEPLIDYSHVIAGPFDNIHIRFRRRPASEVLFNTDISLKG